MSAPAPTLTLDSVRATPNALAPHYSRFRVGERLLLTGHSHQAWPDVGLEAQQEAWLDAADLADRKWARAGEVADVVRAGWRERLGDPAATIALGQNTHELVTRVLSTLPLWGRQARPRLVTTDGEFHTIRRQLDRLSEVAGLEVVKVPAHPVATLAERLAAHATDRTAAVLVSSVLFETSEIVPHLDVLAAACERRGVALVVDAYHHIGVVPFDVGRMGLASAFVIGGGYKYCQLGEGNCFLRVPPGAPTRPVLTGWYSEFGALAAGPRPDTVPYGEGAGHWAGATYDPVSHYRARAVFAFFAAQGLTAPLLHAINRHQAARIVTAFERLDVDPARAALVDVPAVGRGGFVAVRSTDATRLVESLRARGVNTDARGHHLRLGPAPYLSDAQIDEAMARLGAVLRGTIG
ncbi:MAG: kynureninase [Vicinamibacterales bacterium]